KVFDDEEQFGGAAHGLRLALHQFEQIVVYAVIEFVGAVVFANDSSRQIAISSSESVEAAQKHLLRRACEFRKFDIRFDLRLDCKRKGMLCYVDCVIGYALYYRSGSRNGHNETYIRSSRSAFDQNIRAVLVNQIFKMIDLIVFRNHRFGEFGIALRQSANGSRY